MLYDKKWDKQIEIEAPSLDGLIEWLSTKPRDQQYNFYNHEACAVGQYYCSLQRQPIDMINQIAMEFGVRERRVMDLYDALSAQPRTFGACRERLESLRASL